MILQNSYRVVSSQCDTLSHLSPTAVLELVQDSTTELLGNMESDTPSILRKFNAFWVFTRYTVRLYRHLSWMEPFTARSFISRITHGALFVTVLFQTADGQPAAEACLKLCALDRSDMHIRRLAELGLGRDTPSYPELAGLRPGPFFVEAEQPVGSFTVCSQDMDSSHHTNNIAYVRHVLGTFSVSELERRSLKELDIQYAAQTYEGSEIQILRGGDAFSLMNGEKMCMQCRLGFENE